MLKACHTCGTPSNSTHCPAHNTGHTGRSPNRDRQAQHTFRQAVLARDNHACQDCGNTQDLRACHTIPLSLGGTYNPDNGRTLCRTCDKATDPYAR